MPRTTLADRLGRLDGRTFAIEAPPVQTATAPTPAQLLQQFTRVPNWFYTCEYDGCVNRLPASWRSPLGLVLCDYDAWLWANTAARRTDSQRQG